MVREKKDSIYQILNIHLNIILFRKFNEKDYSRNSSPIPVETADNQEQRNLNDFPVRK